MKKITKEILINQYKKESTLTLREAILSRVNFDLEYHCRKNMRKEWREAYNIIQKRFETAHDWEIEPNRLYVINYFFKNNIGGEDLAHYWYKNDGFKSKKEAAKIYNTAAYFLRNIYSNIIVGQYELDCRGDKNHWKDWDKDLAD